MFLYQRNEEKNRSAMQSVDAQPKGDCVLQVSRKFVALYYRVLNDFEGYLFQFYGPDSTVVVSEVKENGQAETTKAQHMPTIQELLRELYKDVTINVRNCTPQSCSAGCISLLVAGFMTRKIDGYYVKTDTVLVFPINECMTGSPIKLMPSMTTCMNEKRLESDDTAMRGADPKMQSKIRAESSHVRVPSIDIHLGMPPMSDNSGYPRQSGHAYMNTISKDKDGFAFDIPTRNVVSIANQFLPKTDINRQGCHTARARENGMVTVCNGLQSKDRCASPVSAPGSLPSPMPMDGLGHDLHFQRQQWSIKSSPRNIVPDATRHAATDVHKLFACKLPLGITTEIVTEVFSKYGTLSADDPVRVFTGQNNCYACVTYSTEQDMQHALDSEIRIGDTAVVTDAWRPRDRRPKRRRSENAEQRLIGAAN